MYHHKNMYEGPEQLTVSDLGHALPQRDHTSLDTDGLVLTLQALQQIGADRYKVLLTKVPPPPEQEGAQLRAELTIQKIPLFHVDIPRLKAFEKAAAAGMTVDQVDDPRARRAWAAYATAGKELFKHGRAK